MSNGAKTLPDPMPETFGIACPTCWIEYAHLLPKPVATGTGIQAPDGPRSHERDGAVFLMECEDGHRFYVGIAEHKGVPYFYVTESIILHANEVSA